MSIAARRNAGERCWARAARGGADARLHRADSRPSDTTSPPAFCETALQDPRLRRLRDAAHPSRPAADRVPGAGPHASGGRQRATTGRARTIRTRCCSTSRGIGTSTRAVGGNDARFINHSCEPNCETEVADGGIWIRAIRNIQPGVELTYDYSLEIEKRASRKRRDEYACRCGAPKCRGTMLGKA